MGEYHINANARSLDVTIGKRRQAEVHVILTGFVTFVCEIFFISLVSKILTELSQYVEKCSQRQPL